MDADDCALPIAANHQGEPVALYASTTVTSGGREWLAYESHFMAWIVLIHNFVLWAVFGIMDGMVVARLPRTGCILVMLCVPTCTVDHRM